MKTFKLKMLHIISDENKEIHIPLLDGLIIDREDEKSNWLIEAYINKQYGDLFRKLEGRERIFVKVKITKESNNPAWFRAKMLGLNHIGENVNVLFLGKLLSEKEIPKTL